MKEIGDILRSAGLQAALGKKEDEAERLIAAWAEVAGVECRAHTTDIKARNGVLHITLDSPAWHQELRLRDLDAMAEAMAHASGSTIVKIKIRTGG